MDIRAQLLKEHSKANSVLIANYIGEDKNRVEELLNLFLANEYRVTQRSSMVFSIISDKHPELLAPYIALLVQTVCNTSTSEAVLRSSVRFFQFYKITEEYQGLLLERCYQLLKNAEKGVAIRAFSIAILYNISEPYEELTNELKLTLEDLYTEGLPGLSGRRKNYLSKIKAIKKPL